MSTANDARADAGRDAARSACRWPAKQAPAAARVAGDLLAEGSRRPSPTVRLPGRGIGRAPDAWLTTETAAAEIGGVTSRWVRLQIERGRLRARALRTGRRVTYRIGRPDLDAFRERFVIDDA